MSCVNRHTYENENTISGYLAPGWRSVIDIKFRTQYIFLLLVFVCYHWATPEKEKEKCQHFRFWALGHNYARTILYLSKAYICATFRLL